MTNDENVQQLAYPGVYADENEIIPYSPRKQFRFMDEDTQQLAYPGVYTDENKIIPYSPRKQFRFMDDKTIKLETMKNMSIDQIVELYKNGYRIEEMSQTSTIATASNDITVSSGAIFLIGAAVLIYMLLKR